MLHGTRWAIDLISCLNSNSNVQKSFRNFMLHKFIPFREVSRGVANISKMEEKIKRVRIFVKETRDTCDGPDWTDFPVILIIPRLLLKNNFSLCCFFIIKPTFSRSRAKIQSKLLMVNLFKVKESAYTLLNYSSFLGHPNFL